MAMRDGKRTILFAEEALAEQLLPVATAWVGSWLIDPFVLVPVPGSPSGTPLVTQIQGVVIGRDGTRPVDVLTLLAQGEYELVRCLALQAIEPGRPILNVEALVERVMSLQQAASPVTRFWRLNLMVFPTATTPAQPLQRVVQGWEVNVVAAPENRSTGRSFDAFVVAEGRKDYAGHLLGNAATAGAMWCGMDVGPYDERTPSGGAATLVSLQRTFVRAVVMDDFLVQVARTGLQRFIEDASPFDDPILMSGGYLIGHEVVSDSQLESVVNTMVGTMMDTPPTSALGYRLRGRALPLAVEPYTLSITEALTSFGRFSLDKLITVPRFLLWRGQQRIAERFTATLHGQDGDARVVLGRDPIGDLSVFVRDLQQAEREKSAVLTHLERTNVEIDFADEQYSEIWSTMRTMAFSMFDGQVGVARSGSVQSVLRGRLREAGFVIPDPDAAAVGESTQKSLVLPTKSSLFPDWRVPFAVSDELSGLLDEDMTHLAREIGWISIDEAEALKRAIDQREEALERAVAVADERRAELLTDLQRDLQLHCELELARGQLNDWLLATEGREVSVASVDRLRRTLARLPGSVSGLVRESIADPLPTAVDTGTSALHDHAIEDGGPPEIGADPDEPTNLALSSEPDDPEAVGATVDDSDTPVDDSPREPHEVTLAAEASTPAFRPGSESGSEPGSEPGSEAGSEASGTPRGPLRSLLRWILAWWRSRREAGPSAFVFGPEEARGIAELLAERIEDWLARLDEEIAGLRKAEGELEAEIAGLGQRVEELAGAAQPFRAWFLTNSRSFAWKLIDRMRAERRLLSDHLDATRMWLASPLPVSPEEARELYERFVRRLRRIVTWGLLVPGAVFLVVRTLLSELARRFGDWIMRGPVGEFAETDIGLLLVRAVQSFLGNPWPTLFGIVLAGTLYAFIAYYRVWSTRKRKVRQLRSDVEHMRGWVQDLKVERLRLNQLERHTTDVLRLLSEFLHRPFVIPAQPIRGRSAGPVGGAESTMSLSVAEPLWDANWQGQHAFESRIIARHARRGWLEDDYRSLSSTVEEVTGQPRGSFSVAHIEASSRARRALLQLLEDTNDEARIAIGQRMERDILREMIGWDLSDDLPFPVVVETRVPPTDGIDVRLDLLDDERHDVHPWIDFMLHHLPTGESDAVEDEWSAWTISVSAHEEVRRDLRTVVHGPQRYRGRVERRRPGSFIPLRVGEIRPVELVIRVDYVLDRSLADVRGCEQPGGADFLETTYAAKRALPNAHEDLDV